MSSYALFVVYITNEDVRNVTANEQLQNENTETVTAIVDDTGKSKVQVKGHNCGY